MKNVWPVLRGIVIALASIGLLFGGLSLSLAESGPHVPAANTLPPTPTSSSTFTATVTEPAAPKITATRTSTPTLLLPSPTLSPALNSPISPTIPTNSTAPTASTTCPPPAGWVAYTVKSGDTLVLLAARYRTSITSLKQSNCLATTVVTPGTIIYVPPLATQTRIPCGAPSGWILYIVQHGDTLFKLSQAYGITVTQLQNANCMGSSTLLRVGDSIRVPPWAPIIPSPTFGGGQSTFVPTDTIGQPTGTIIWASTDTPIPTTTP